MQVVHPNVNQNIKTHSFNIRKVAVLGAGSLGTQLALHLVNAGLSLFLFDHKSKEGDPNAITKAALEELSFCDRKHGEAFVDRSLLQFIHPVNYEHDTVLLKDCDLIIDTLSDRL